ncbi:MAG: tyrosine-type recombinase/integrase [Acidimicrobiales bacterium]
MARKRSNAEGSIYYRESRKRWEAVLVTGWKTVERADGTTVRRPERRTITGKLRKDVAARLDAAKAALDQGLDVPDARTTLADFATWWAANVLPGEGLAPATERWYRDILDTYVIPHVGARTLRGPRALTPGDVEHMTAQLRTAARKKHPDRAGYSHRVAEAARTTLGKVLRAAERRGLIERNVARIARPPGDRGKARPVKAFTVAEVDVILTGLDDSPWHPVVVVGVTTGLRPAELLALHWPDLDLGADPHLSVRHALTFVDGIALKAPKRERSYRTVPLTPEAVTALKAWRKAQAADRLAAGGLWSTDWPQLVFTTPDGRPRRVDSFRHTLGRVMPGAHPHRLRHTYATHLLEAGTPIHHVAELLGDSVATVEATYSHVLRHKSEVAAVARGLVGGGT